MSCNTCFLNKIFLKWEPMPYMQFTQRQNTRCNMKIFYHTLPHLSSEQSISHKLSGVSLETISFTVELVDDMSFRCTHNCASIVFSAIPHWSGIFFMGSHLIFHPNDVIVKIFKWGFSYV